MNLGEIKAFLGDRAEQARQNLDVKEQLREAGLQQAAKGLSLQGAVTGAFSSQTSIAIRVFNSSLSQSIELNQKKADLPAPKKQDSLFDFEEVATNVLRFVGGAIQKAAASGADEEKLLEMFGQARSGVIKGISLAEKDLEGFMSDEIRNGINSSQDLIEKGIERLQAQLLGNAEDPAESNVSQRVSQSVSASASEQGSILIRTRDGDEVSVNFESLRQFEFNRQALSEERLTQPVEPETPSLDRVTPQTSNEVAEFDETVKGVGNEAADQPVTNAEPKAEQPIVAERASVQAESEEAETSIDEASTETTTLSAEASYLFYDREEFSFSLQGELDEDELNAIGDLVFQVNELAETFFSGDVEQAFENALNLGFDEQELTGFALQLTRTEQVQVVQAYESVALYDRDVNEIPDAGRAAKPVSDYLEQMLSVFEQSKYALQGEADFDKLLSGIINQIEDVKTNDIIEAINQFRSFNQRLLNNLPSAVTSGAPNAS